MKRLHNCHAFLRALACASWLPNRWSVGALLIGAIVLMPVLSVIWFSITPDDDIWQHLWATTFPRYLQNSLLLMVSVGAVCAGVGALTAWMVGTYDFPMRRILEWALLAPLAVPAYVGAYALVDSLEYAGPVQTTLRQLMGWSSAQDYYFPAIRSKGAAIFVLSMSLYPYVYLMARVAFREQSGAVMDVARSLGAGPYARFFKVALPMARPAIIAGCAVAMMETLSDFGTLDYFAVQTLTTGIFTVWLEAGNLGGASQISVSILALVICLVILEKFSRRRSRFFAGARVYGGDIVRVKLPFAWGLLATAICGFPVLAGFVLPVTVLLSHALDVNEWTASGFLSAWSNTVVVGSCAAVITLAAAIFVVYGARLSKSALPRLLVPLSMIGYATPGAVLGIGILVPLASFDNWFADQILAVTDYDIGLLLTGGIFAIILAYTVRFFALAFGAVDAAMGRISPSLPMAARSLGRTAGQTLRAVHVPMVRASLSSALLLVFVDTIKELPATLLLRPFGYETLATRVYAKASLENITEAAPAALMIVFVGLGAVALLAKASRL